MAGRADRLPPRVLFEASFFIEANPFGAYDVTADGQRLIVLHESEAHTELVIVRNWSEELERMVPTG